MINRIIAEQDQIMAYGLMSSFYKNDSNYPYYGVPAQVYDQLVVAFRFLHADEQRFIQDIYGKE
jgi:hypothetical protein